MQVSQMKRVAKQEQWKQRITECRSSGIPVKEWCKQHGVCPSTYYRYEQELLRDAQEANDQLALEAKPPPLPVSFVEVSGECQAKSKEIPTYTISISVSAPGFKLKITLPSSTTPSLKGRGLPKPQRNPKVLRLCLIHLVLASLPKKRSQNKHWHAT